MANAETSACTHEQCPRVATISNHIPSRVPIEMAGNLDQEFTTYK